MKTTKPKSGSYQGAFAAVVVAVLQPSKPQHFSGARESADKSSFSSACPFGGTFMLPGIFTVAAGGG